MTTDIGESVFFSATDGLRLHAVDYGRGISDALPLVCLPGLSRNARDFTGFAEHFVTQAAPKRRVVCFDYRGRGLSEWDKNWENYNVLTEAEDVLAGMAALGIEHAAFVGTSRGGLISMVLSAMRPVTASPMKITVRARGSALNGFSRFIASSAKPRAR